MLRFETQGNQKQGAYNLVLGGPNAVDGNWNIGCKASEVFTQLEFKRKNWCEYLKEVTDIAKFLSVGNVYQADHSLQKQSRDELRNVNANADIPERKLSNYFFFFFK